MTDRSVLVRLRADVSGYISGIQAAALETKDFGVATLATAEKHKQSWDKVGKASMLVGGVIAIGVGEAVKAAAEFDAGMSVVKANIDDKTLPSMQRLSDAALTAGKSTMFSATQAADAENELAKAGLSAADITGGALAGALALASAGQLDLGAAAAIAATSMVQFHLSAKDVPHIADLLAAGADKALGGVSDLAEAMKYSGVVAAQFGISIEETTGTLALFAMNGLLGSMAGTGFREMLVMLAKPTKEGAAELAKYNIAAFDASGKFVGMAGLAGQLKSQLAGLSDQQRQATLVTLFGTRALAEANILYAAGSVGIKEWTNKVNEQGFAALQASTKMDNLNGDLTKLKNTLNAAFIEGGQAGQGPLRELTQGLTGVVDTFGSLPAPVSEAMLAIGGVTAATLLLGGTAVLATTRIAAMKVSLETMGMAGGKATGIIKGFGIAAIAAAVAIPVLGAASDALSSALGHLAPGSNEAGRALTEFASTGKATGDAAKLINTGFAQLGDTVNNVLNAGLGGRVRAFGQQIDPAHWFDSGSATTQSIEFFKTLDSGLSAMTSSGHAAQAAGLFKKVTDEAVKQGYTIAQVADAFPTYAAAVTGAGTASDGAAKSVEVLAREQSKLSEISVTLGGDADATGAAMRILGDGADAASDAVKALAKVIQGDMDSAAKAFAADMDVLGGYDPAKQADAVAAAQDTLDKAKAAASSAGDAAGTRGNTVSEAQQLAKAEQAVHDATGKSAAKAAKARQNLADLEARLADRHKTTVSQMQGVDKANTAVSDAREALDKAKRAQSAASLENSYAAAVKAGTKFADDIDKVTRAGLDPQVVAKLLQEGPTKAGPALQALLGSHSKTMIKMVNDSEKSLAAINARVVEQARLTSMAVNAQNDKMSGDLATAIGISSAKAGGGGKATVASIAAQMKISEPEVKRIADEFGIGILDGVVAGVNPAVTSIDRIAGKLRSIRDTDWTITVPVVVPPSLPAAGVPAAGGPGWGAPGYQPLGPRPAAATPAGRPGTTTNTTNTHQPVNIYGPVNTPSHSDLLIQAARLRRTKALGAQ